MQRTLGPCGRSTGEQSDIWMTNRENNGHRREHPPHTYTDTTPSSARVHHVPMSSYIGSLDCNNGRCGSLQRCGVCGKRGTRGRCTCSHLKCTLWQCDSPPPPKLCTVVQKGTDRLPSLLSLFFPLFHKTESNNPNNPIHHFAPSRAIKRPPTHSGQAHSRTPRDTSRC